MAESVLLSSIDTYSIDDPTFKVATDNVYAEGSSVRCERIEYRDPADTDQTADKVINVTFGNDGVFTSGNDFFGNEYSYIPFELDDLGRPVASSFEEVTLSAMVKPYGDGSVYAQPQLFEGPNGFITLTGLASVVNSANPLVANSVIATLPAEYAPNQQRIFVVQSNVGPVRVDVRQNGDITLAGSASVTQYISFDGISFPRPM